MAEIRLLLVTGSKRELLNGHAPTVYDRLAELPAGTLPGSFKNLLDWTVGGVVIADPATRASLAEALGKIVAELELFPREQG